MNTGFAPQQDVNAGFTPQQDGNAGFTPQQDVNTGFTGGDQPLGFDPQNNGYNQGGYEYQGAPNGYGYQGGPNNYGYQQVPYYGPATGITGRNIILSILFSFLTFGVYYIYWFIVLTDEVNQLSNRNNDTSGALAFILNIVTCHIYGWYWAYKLGEKTDYLKNMPSGGSSVLFLILQLFNFGFVNLAIAQDAVNKAVGYQG